MRPCSCQATPQFAAVGIGEPLLQRITSIRYITLLDTDPNGYCDGSSSLSTFFTDSVRRSYMLLYWADLLFIEYDAVINSSNYDKCFNNRNSSFNKWVFF
jgi:hypothetical protein